MSGKILVVDDSTFNLKLLQAILRNEDYEVFITGNSLEVVDMAIAVKPSTILLDVVMPGLDGFQICRLLKKEPEVMDVPVIIVTAKTDVKDLKTAFDLGAFDYIKKPLDEIEVIARVKSALRFKEQQDRLREMAFKDGLTGLFNHAVLMELFEKEIKKQERSKQSVSFMMLDIDFFKKVNDTYGHLAGDMILKQIADILKCSVRDSDIVGRYGGEEFGIVLPETNAQAAFVVGVRIRQAVERYFFDIGTEKAKTTLSVGIHTKNYADAIECKEVIKKADEALYKAKQKGRNRVELFEALEH